jgi:hypothetical protein
VFQLCFNFNKIHDSVGKALRTADQDRTNSHALSSSFHPGLGSLVLIVFFNVFKVDVGCLGFLLLFLLPESFITKHFVDFHRYFS